MCAGGKLMEAFVGEVILCWRSRFRELQAERTRERKHQRPWRCVENNHQLTVAGMLACW